MGTPRPSLLPLLDADFMVRKNAIHKGKCSSGPFLAAFGFQTPSPPLFQHIPAPPHQPRTRLHAVSERGARQGLSC